jgi:hypothetical protein
MYFSIHSVKEGSLIGGKVIGLICRGRSRSLFGSDTKSKSYNGACIRDPHRDIDAAQVQEARGIAFGYIYHRMSGGIPRKPKILKGLAILRELFLFLTNRALSGMSVTTFKDTMARYQR